MPPEAVDSGSMMFVWRKSATATMPSSVSLSSGTSCPLNFTDTSASARTWSRTFCASTRRKLRRSWATPALAASPTVVGSVTSAHVNVRFAAPRSNGAVPPGSSAATRVSTVNAMSSAAEPATLKSSAPSRPVGVATAARSSSRRSLLSPVSFRARSSRSDGSTVSDASASVTSRKPSRPPAERSPSMSMSRTVRRELPPVVSM